MVINIESLTKKYSDWLFQNTTTRKVKDTIEITLPYLDRNNDCIQVYLFCAAVLLLFCPTEIEMVGQHQQSTHEH